MNEPAYNLERELAEAIVKVRQDRKLFGQALRLVKLSLDLRNRGYTGSVVLNLGGGLVGNVELVQRSDWKLSDE